MSNNQNWHNTREVPAEKISRVEKAIKKVINGKQDKKKT